ncbi:MAG TPA: ATP-binding cassette domain-containing protein, partial [Bacteroidia bacterium]|nr:ATP-binding cassette domain-containing protein [Bacteroidia bacterium]
MGENHSHISVKNLNVHIGNKHILKNINVEIPDKKITCIIGPSGCGKTTLFKTFNRLLENTNNTRIEGNVLVDGRDIYAPDADVTAIRKKMGLLNQRPTPLPMSIYANVV